MDLLYICGIQPSSVLIAGPEARAVDNTSRETAAVTRTRVHQASVALELGHHAQATSIDSHLPIETTTACVILVRYIIQKIKCHRY